MIALAVEDVEVVLRDPKYHLSAQSLSAHLRSRENADHSPLQVRVEA
jgi:hypothetical protein